MNPVHYIEVLVPSQPRARSLGIACIVPVLLNAHVLTVRCPDEETFQAMSNWCRENVGEWSLADSPTVGLVRFLISGDADAVEFRLRWSEEAVFVDA